MYKCNNCNKEFKYNSWLIRHETICKKEKKIYKCDICNIICKRPSEYDRHKISKRCIEKHKLHNINNITNINSNNIYNINNIQNNIHLTLQTNGFSNTNIEYIKKYEIEYLLTDIGFKNSIKMLNDNTFIDKPFIIEQGFKIIIDIFKMLNFNLAHEQNHNIKIFLFTQSRYNKYIEYHLLEIDNEKKQYTLNFVKYDIFIIELLNLMKKIDNKFNIINFHIILEFIMENIDIVLKQIIQKNIEEELLNIYNLFKNDKEKYDKDNNILMENIINERNKML